MFTKRLNNEDGFTLIETICTLFIISLTLMISVLSIDKIIEETRIELFFRELTADITLMQTHALLTGQNTKIEFKMIDGISLIDYSFKYNSDKPVHPLEKTVVIDPEIGRLLINVPVTIEYNSKGNISNFGNVNFVMKNSRYRLTYMLGSARFEIEKRDP